MFGAVITEWWNIIGVLLGIGGLGSAGYFFHRGAKSLATERKKDIEWHLEELHAKAMVRLCHCKENKTDSAADTEALAILQEIKMCCLKLGIQYEEQRVKVLLSADDMWAASKSKCPNMTMAQLKVAEYIGDAVVQRTVANLALLLSDKKYLKQITKDVRAQMKSTG